MDTQITVTRTYAELMSAWVAAINSQDVAGMVDCFTEDVHFEDVAVKRVCRGRAELTALIADWMEEFRETRARLLSTTALGNAGAAEWELTVVRRIDRSTSNAGSAAADEPIRLRGACIDEIAAEGRISNHRDYWNTADLEP